MKGKEVYILVAEYNMKGDAGHDILGVFSELADAQKTMRSDIADIKSNWGVTETDWEVEEDSDICYEAHDSDYEWQYSVSIETYIIK